MEEISSALGILLFLLLITLYMPYQKSIQPAGFEIASLDEFR